MRIPPRFTVVSLVVLLGLFALRAGDAAGSATSGSGPATGGGAAAAQESFKTDLFTGGMSTSVPILLPEGTNGFQPSITLSYDSHRGNTWIGRGWELSFNAIRRVTKHGNPTFDDDPTTGDRFSIGDDRLVLADNGFYRSYLENFLRVERVDDGSGNVLHWIAHGTDGSTSWYGYTANARIDGPSGRPLVWLLERRIDRVGNFIRYEYHTDAETGGVRARYPKRVAYSFRGDGGEALGSAFPSSATVRSVSFAVEPRPDPSLSYQGGHLVRANHRLTSIDVKKGSALVARYDLVYLDETGQGAPGAHANGRSLLYEVVRIGADGVSTLPGQTFSYSGSTSPAYSASGSVAQQFATVFNGLDLADARWGFPDVNGDAAVDAVFTSSSNDIASVQLSRKGTAGQHGFWPTLASDALAYAVPLADADGPGIAIPETPIAVRGLDTHWADYTGDGKPDLMSGRFQYFSVLDHPLVTQTIMCDDGSGGQVPCESLVEDSKRTYRNVGWNWVDENALPAQATTTLPAKSGYENLPTNVATIMQCGTWTFVPPSTLQLNWVPIVMGVTKLVDLDGDGLNDILEHRIPNPQSISCDDYAANYQNDEAAWRAQFTTRNVYLNVGGGWQSSPDSQWSARLSTVLANMQATLGQVSVFDLNGDGFADFGPDKDGDGDVDTASRIYLATGNAATGWVQATGAGFTGIPNGFRPIDIDGDGLPDHLSSNPLFNTGAGLVSPSGGYSAPGWFGSIGSQDLVADLDGDGLVDHLHSDGSASTAHASSDGDSGGNDVAPEGILTGIQLAAGGSVSVDYASSAEGSCYDAVSGGCHASAVAWPIAQIPGCPLPFVTATASAENGVDPGAGGDLCAFFVQNLPFLLQTVVSTSSDDANGNARTDQIAYDTGAYSASSREHRGFGRVTESPQTLDYTNPVTLGTETVNATKVTRFYQKAFLRGQPAITSTYGMIGGQLSLLETIVGKYFVTRADMTTTYVLQGLGYRLACDIDAEGQTSNCADLFDVQTLDLSFLPIGLPFDRFQAGFGPANADASAAFLVLNAGRTTLLYDGDATAVQIENTQYHDPYGNVQFTIQLGDLADATDDAASIAAYAEDVCYTGVGSTGPECFPATLPRNLHSLPSGTTGLSYTNTGGSLSFTVLSFETMDYDGGSNGYTTAGNLTRTTNGLGASTQIVGYEYDAVHYGRPARVSDPHLAGGTAIFEEFVYDASQTHVTSKTYAGTLTTTRTYDPAGAPPGLGLVFAEVDDNGAWIAYGADTFGRGVCGTRVYPEGTPPPTGGDPCALDVLSQTIHDDSPGFDPQRAVRTTTVFDGSGNASTTRMYVDGFARPIRVERDGLEPNGAGGEVVATIVSTMSYDVLGRLETRGRPYFSGDTPGPGTTTYHDERNRARFAIAPNGGVAETQYHKLTTTEIDAEGRQRISRGDGRGRRVSVTEFDGAQSYETTYQYDPMGRLRGICNSQAATCPVVDCSVQTCNAVGGDPLHTVLIQYDHAGQRTSLIDPDLGLSTYAYDGAGRLTSVTDANGDTVTGVYDSLGRLECENPTGVASCLPVDGADVFYTYGDEPGAPVASHGSNRPVFIETPLADYSYEYEPGGGVSSARMVLADGSGDYTRGWTYDWIGRRTSASHPDGETIFQSYDAMGVDRVWSAQRVYVDDVLHNAELKPLSVEYGNGVVRDVAYEAGSGFVDRLYDHVGATALLDRHYDYDLTGKITDAADAVRSEESLAGVQYDGLGRLTQYSRGGGPVVSNVYDPLGNLTSKEGMLLPYQHPTKPHAVYDAADPSRYAYDARGNMVMRNGRTLGYDARSRLVSMTGDLPSSFTYDHGNQRSSARYGADGSVYFGPDLEIMNGVRFIKTLRVTGMLAARVATVPMGGGQASAAVMGRVARADLLHDFAAAQAGLLALGLVLALPWWRRNDLPLLRAVPAGVLAAAIVFAPTGIALAQIPTGDLNDDGKIDVLDAIIMERIIAGDLQPTAEQQEDADVAPLELAPDGSIDVGDSVLLRREAAGEGVDGDGLPADLELPAGASPFRFDSDGDGLSDAAELTHGTDPAQTDTDQDGLDDATEVSLGTNPLVADTDGDGLVDSRDADPLTMSTELVHYVHADHLGGTAVLSNTSGVAVREIYYGIWGEERRNALLGGAAATTPKPDVGFTAQRIDRGTGLMYFGARYFDPEIGRFTQPDPIVPALHNPQSLNRYAYTLNDPLNRIDPSGNWSFGGMMSGIGSAFGSIGSAIGGFARGFGSAIGGFASSVWGGFSSFMNSTMNFINDTIRWANQMAAQAHRALQNSLRWSGQFVGSVGNLLSSAAKPVIRVTGRTVKSLGSAIAGAGTALAGGLSSAGKQIGQGISAVGSAIGAGAKAIGGAVYDALADGPLGYLWNLPNTAIGIAYGVAGMAVGAAASLAWGALHVATLGRLGGFRWFGGSINFDNNAIQFHNNPLQLSAITLGNTIIYSRRAGFTASRVGPHEQQHTIQGQVLGPAYLPAHIFLGTAATLVDGYWHGPVNLLERGPQAATPRPW